MSGAIIGWFVCKLRKRHDWANVTSYYTEKDETNTIVHYNWCLKCGKIKILANSKRKIKC